VRSLSCVLILILPVELVELVEPVANPEDLLDLDMWMTNRRQIEFDA
jgi:hypothetical protein